MVNQRYYLIGAQGQFEQELEINSNHERMQACRRLKNRSISMERGTSWYRIKSRVDVAADGSGVVRAKAWKKGDPEPEGWLIEVPHKQAHAYRLPGASSGFCAAGHADVYIDNIVTVTAEPLKFETHYWPNAQLRM